MRRFQRPRRGVLAPAALVLVLVAGCGHGGDERPSRPARAPAAVPAGAASARATTIVDAGQRVEKAALPAEGIAGTVIRVRDGDSLVVLVARERFEVRLDSVDAPELAQAFGKRAQRCTADVAFGKQVRLEVKGRDAYNRNLAEVFLPDGRSLNRELVSAGCAWWFRRYSTDADLEARERQARAEHRGLWADPEPVPPWKFREEHPREGGGGR